jgi:hypothetical protein
MRHIHVRRVVMGTGLLFVVASAVFSVLRNM